MKLSAELEDLQRQLLLQAWERGLETVVSLVLLPGSDAEEEDDLVRSPRRRKRRGDAARVGGVELDALLDDSVGWVGGGKVLGDLWSWVGLGWGGMRWDGVG